jgi:hypothetical protein
MRCQGMWLTRSVGPRVPPDATQTETKEVTHLAGREGRRQTPVRETPPLQASHATHPPGESPAAADGFPVPLRAHPEHLVLAALSPLHCRGVLFSAATLASDFTLPPPRAGGTDTPCLCMERPPAGECCPCAGLGRQLSLARCAPRACRIRFVPPRPVLRRGPDHDLATESSGPGSSKPSAGDIKRRIAQQKLGSCP